jgi:hypothetical protein
MTTITAVWQGVDAPRMEIAHVTINGPTVVAQGTQIGLAYELRYALRDSVLDVEVVGQRSGSLELGGADFFDLGFSPLFNALPVHRDHLLRSEQVAPREYDMLWVSVPDLRTHRSQQQYTPLGNHRVKFSSGVYRARLDFDADGLVRFYEGLAERVS